MIEEYRGCTYNKVTGEMQFTQGLSVSTYIDIAKYFGKTVEFAPIEDLAMSMAYKRGKNQVMIWVDSKQMDELFPKQTHKYSGVELCIDYSGTIFMKDVNGWIKVSEKQLEQCDNDVAKEEFEVYKLLQ
ncbi:hypothetical protein D3C78_20620 [compost metagenome]